MRLSSHPMPTNRHDKQGINISLPSKICWKQSTTCSTLLEFGRYMWRCRNTTRHKVAQDDIEAKNNISTEHLHFLSLFSSWARVAQVFINLEYRRQNWLERFSEECRIGFSLRCFRGVCTLCAACFQASADQYVTVSEKHLPPWSGGEGEGEDASQDEYRILSPLDNEQAGHFSLRSAPNNAVSTIFVLY